MIVAAPPPPHTTSVDVFGQPPRSAEIAGRPLGSTLRLFRSGASVVIPTWHGRSLSAVAADMRAGALVPAKARQIGDVYVVPTRRGGLCMQAPAFATCHRGLLGANVTYSFQSSPAGIDVYGIAADDVRRVALDGRKATLIGNLFFVTRPMKLTSTTHHLPKTFGTLTVWYRDGTPPMQVPIR